MTSLLDSLIAEFDSTMTNLINRQGNLDEASLKVKKLFAEIKELEYQIAKLDSQEEEGMSCDI